MQPRIPSHPRHRITLDILFAPIPDKDRCYGFYKSLSLEHKIIVIDSTMNMMRQISTLAHEMYHFLVDVYIKDEFLRGNVKNEEKYAEEFQDSGFSIFLKHIGIETIKK